MVKFIHPDLFEPVRAGDVVAGLDESALVARLTTARAEVVRLRTILAAERNRLAIDRQDRETVHLVEIQRFAWNLESAELDLLDRRLAQEVARVEKERLTIIHERERRLSGGSVGRKASLEEARLALQSVTTSIAQNEEILVAARARRDAARKRLDQASGRDNASLRDVDVHLDPIRQAMAVQQASLDELAVTRSALTLRAPMDGRVSQRLLRPGETVRAGEPVVVIADPLAARVLAHVPESSGRTDLRAGDPVEIRRRTSPVQIIQGRILRVGPAREKIPLQARRVPDRVEWGCPILITATALPVDPGETVDVRIPAAPR